MSKRPFILSIIIVGIILMTILSAGCFGVSFSPDEVKVHGNIISVDSEVIGDEAISNLLFSPNDYESSYISAISTYIPKSNPVLEIGAKLGIVTAFVSDQLLVGTSHIAVEENPEIFNLLTQTKKNNSLVTKLENAVINYDVTLPDDPKTVVTVPYDSQKGASFENIFETKNSDKVVRVPVTTVSRLLSDDLLKDNTNITLLIDDDNVAKNLFIKERKLADSVANIFMNIKDSSLVKTLVKQAAVYGYVNTTYPAAGKDGYTVLVFKRTTADEDLTQFADSELTESSEQIFSVMSQLSGDKLTENLEEKSKKTSDTEKTENKGN